MNSRSSLASNPVRIAAFAAIATIALTPHALARDVGAEAAKPQAAPAQPATPPAQTGGYPAVPLLSTSKTIVGETIRYPRTGEAHVTAAIFTLEPGGKSILHKHGVPLFAYILEGELTVDYGKHGTRTYKKGDALMEAMNVAHFSVNNGAEPVRLLAVYMGARGGEGCRTGEVTACYAIRPGTAQGSRLFSKERIGIANFSRIETEENVTSQRARKFFSDGED